MGNTLTQSATDEKGKVILPDGTIHEYDKPLTVAELMLEYPQQVVVEFDPQITAGGNNKKRPSPLPADKNLEMKKLYLLVPIKRGKPAALSSEEAQRLIMSANSILRSKTLAVSFTGFVPLFARICTAASSQQPRTRMIKRNSVEEERFMTKSDVFAEILEERPEFLSRQLSGKGWKPSLDTITEKNVNIKVRHWLFKN
ncbi:hypothetical protein M9H77_05867 [Catharanthus roseus]|uniref:Uncharacterized protein n=1 Tax=Catharanthus roseus TaxID=4058 RepID=A0ACC0BQI4_CATRO|nr:hypothetical protein M9H77_05867 [Catharanthus roseus]